MDIFGILLFYEFYTIAFTNRKIEMNLYII